MNQSNKSPSELLQFAFSLHQTGDLNGAEKIYRQLIEADPGNLPALHYLGVIEASYGNYEQATQLMARSVAIDHPDIQFIENYAALSYKTGDYEAALKLCGQGLKIQHNYVPLIYMSAVSLFQMNRLQESLATFDRVLLLQPNHVIAINERGSVLATIGRFDEALSCFEKVLALNPQYADAVLNKGNLFRELKRHDESLAAYEHALTLKPDLAAAWLGRGSILRKMKRYEDAVQSFERLVQLAPDEYFGKGYLLHTKMLCCDWERIAPLMESIQQDVRAGKKSAEPFGYQGISDSEQDLKLCAEIYAADKYPRPQTALWTGERYHNAKIRIGYSSGEFRDQATSILMTELFELHDKNRFELFAVDNGWDDGSEIRERINQAFDAVINIRHLHDLEAASVIQKNRIEILVNLNGYFGDARPGVFRHKPSPVQINYLGFPGTIVAECMDYILADRHVIPPGHEAYYMEKVVFLPDCYQVNDSKRVISSRTFTRTEVELPATGFVFCCFNNNYKITPEIFDLWMRLLNAVEGSVLWLLEDNATASGNLRREAKHRGVSDERLVFAPRVQSRDHLSRHRLADLFLDTLPYNAHTTASDALWAGLPILTCLGSTFPGRVAASLLNAVGLPELITHSLEDYEALALKLARDPALLASLKQKLARNRDTCPLFNTARFTRHLEAAYTNMWERYQRGEPPASFAVDPID